MMKTIGMSDDPRADPTIRKQSLPDKSGFAKAALLAAGIALSSCHSTATIQQPPRPAAVSATGSGGAAVAGESTCERELVATQQDSSITVQAQVCHPDVGCTVLDERRNTATVRVGHRMLFGGFTIRVAGIDSAGVDFIFEGPGLPDSLRLEYGKVQTIGEFVLVSAMRVEPGHQPGTVRIIDCQPTPRR